MTRLFDFPEFATSGQLRPKSRPQPRLDDQALAKALEATGNVAENTRRITRSVVEMSEERKQSERQFQIMYSEIAELARSLDARESQLEKFATEMMAACQSLEERINVVIGQLQTLAERGTIPTSDSDSEDSGEIRQLLAQVLSAVGQSHSSISFQLESIGAASGAVEADIEDGEDEPPAW